MLDIFVDSAGRLGNQLFQASAALHLQHRLGETGQESTIWWMNADDATGQMMELLNIRIHEKSTRFRSRWRSMHGPEGVCGFVGRVAEKIHYEIQNHRFLVVDDSWSDFGSIDFNADTSILLRGYFQRGQFAEAAVLNLARDLDKLLPGELLDILIDEQPIMIQVRLSDFLMFPARRAWGVLAPLYYKRAIEALAGMIDLDNHPIWLVSEDLNLAQALLNDAVRIDGVLDPLRWKLSPQAKLAAMATGGGLIVSTSTFSWWGAYLSRGRIPVVAPTPITRTDDIDLPSLPAWGRVDAVFL